MSLQDPKDSKPEDSTTEKAPKEKQQQSDPQITELKGLTDPDEPLEVEGTDNPV